jgi:hypothetical protein
VLVVLVPAVPPVVHSDCNCRTAPSRHTGGTSLKRSHTRQTQHAIAHSVQCCCGSLTCTGAEPRRRAVTSLVPSKSTRLRSASAIRCAHPAVGWIGLCRQTPRRATYLSRPAARLACRTCSRSSHRCGSPATTNRFTKTKKETNAARVD